MVEPDEDGPAGECAAVEGADALELAFLGLQDHQYGSADLRVDLPDFGEVHL